MRGDWIDVPPLARPVVGPLPRRTRAEGPWPARTREAWEAWRADPVTALYGPADRAFLLDLAFVHAHAITSGRVTALAEVRLRIDALGLSPKGRRDLRWRAAQDRPRPDLPAASPPSARSRMAELRRRAAAADTPTRSTR